MEVGDQVSFIDEDGQERPAEVVRVRGGHRCDLSVRGLGLRQMVSYDPAEHVVSSEAPTPQPTRIRRPSSMHPAWLFYAAAAVAGLLGSGVGELVTHLLLLP